MKKTNFSGWKSRPLLRSLLFRTHVFESSSFSPSVRPSVRQSFVNDDLLCWHRTKERRARARGEAPPPRTTRTTLHAPIRAARRRRFEQENGAVCSASWVSCFSRGRGRGFLEAAVGSLVKCPIDPEQAGLRKTSSFLSSPERMNE